MDKWEQDFLPSELYSSNSPGTHTAHSHARATHAHTRHLASEESDLTLCVCGGAEYEYFKLDEKLFPEGSNPIQVITTRSNFSSPQIGAHPSGPMWP